MRYQGILEFFIVVPILFTAAAKGQNPVKNPAPDLTDSLSKIRTGDVLDSIKYYIKIAPVDTMLDKSMPKYKPDEATFVPVDVQPVPLKQVQPQYPTEARASKLKGKVWVKCLVGKNGKVRKAEVVQSDDVAFNKPAISAALQWFFSPAMVKGKPVEVWAAIPFMFDPEKKTK